MPDQRPNIVLILVDDADAKVLEHAASARIRSAVAAQGATASQYLTTHPQCGPSRASILRGMYPQNTGVVGNSQTYANFKSHGGENSNVALWLQAAGYRTGLIGKYLNGYQVDPANLNPPPGWDFWFGVGHDAYDSYDYDANDNGVLVHYGINPQTDYLTDVLAVKALEFIAIESSDPFFLMLAPMTPHSPSIPADDYDGLYSNELYPTTTSIPPNRSFNESDASDKPWYVANLPLLTTAQINKIHQRYRDRLECMESVADLVQGVIAKLDEVQGRLDNTYVFFTSDHGFHIGEHRLGHDSIQDEVQIAVPGGKNSMYEEDIRVPLWVRGPDIASESTITQLVGNVDLAPTFCDIAGVVWDTDEVDGRSFLPLLHGQSVPWRTRYLISRGQLKEYAGIRHGNWVFAELDNPAPSEVAGEYYNLDPGSGLDYDPYELKNLYLDLDAGDLTALQANVAAYRYCSGDSCRAADSV